MERDEKAILYTSVQYGNSLKKLAERIVNDEETAKECENDTYMRAWESIPPHEPRDYFYQFLAKITRFLALDRLKESTRLKRSAEIVELTQELEGLTPAKDNTSEEVEGKLLNQSLNTFVRMLSPEKRNIFLRRYWFMDSVAEIAERFDMTQGKVKTILFRVRNDLKKYLEKEGYYL